MPGRHSLLAAGSLILLLTSSFPLEIAEKNQGNASSTAAAMREAALHFLTTLDERQQEKVQFAFDNAERENWFFVPITGQRKGLALLDMTSEQRIAVDAVLRSLLSAQGYLKVSMVRQLERILSEIEQNPAYRNPDYYYFTLFGTPGNEEPWAWRWEGHHLSLNVSIVGDKITATPTFMGSNPGTVQEGVYAGLRVLADEEELGRALARSLADDQWQKALLDETAPRDILTSNERRVNLTSYEGISFDALSNEQQSLFIALLGAYVNNLDQAEATVHWNRIKEAGMENLHFAWAGGTEPGTGSYYRIHGPVTLIEYDNTQGNANHVHSVWRDPANDFGEDLLHQHYQQASPDHGH